MKVVVLILSLLVAATLGHASIQDNDSAPVLDRVVTETEMSDTLLEEAFSHLLISQHATGGMALVFTCSSDGEIPRPKFSFNFSGGTIREALDQIVQKDDNYQWKEINQQIILYPRQGMPDLLNTMIGHFEIDGQQKKYTLAAASSGVLGLTEVKKRRSELQFEGPGLQLNIGGIDQLTLLKSKVSVKNATMYQTLNAIARANGVGVWRYAEVHCDGEHLVNVTWDVR
jgi:hypothetical protein